MLIYLQMSQICPKMATFLFSAFFGSHICYHSNGKSQINTRLLHLGYWSNKLIGRNWWKTIFIFWPHRGWGHNSPLMHVVLCQVKHILFCQHTKYYSAISLKAAADRSPCHIWHVGRMKFASLEINLGGGLKAFYSTLISFIPAAYVNTQAAHLCI